MPANRVVETAYIGPFASYDKVNTATLYKPGELGIRVADAFGREYQFVQLDSGATASTTVGAVAVGQLAFWKDKSKYLVTNDIIQCVGGSSAARNEVAGVFQVAGTAGNYCYVQQKGRSVNACALVSSSPNIGDWIVADNTAAKAQCAVVAIATAPTVQPLGKAAASGSSVTTIAVDLDIPGIP